MFQFLDPGMTLFQNDSYQPMPLWCNRKDNMLCFTTLLQQKNQTATVVTLQISFHSYNLPVQPAMKLFYFINKRLARKDDHIHYTFSYFESLWKSCMPFFV